MAQPFPAILLGGPPHSGKSTLAHRLSRALHARSIAHYLLRASPDGEGNWTYETPEGVGRALRVKTDWTPKFAELIAKEVADRRLPLLVDAGGRVSDETRLIADACTHAIVIAAELSALDPWRELATGRSLALLADLQSQLKGVQLMDDAGPTLRGIVTGLERGGNSDGPCFDALVERLAAICVSSQADLARAQADQVADVLLLDLYQPIFPLGPHDPVQNRWRRDELPILLDSLPPDEDLAVFGVAPPWVYGALAGLNPARRFQLYDKSLGWVEPIAVVGGAAAGPALGWTVDPSIPGQLTLELGATTGHLDYRAEAPLVIPEGSTDLGIVLSGKLPNWLFTALVRAYTRAPWIAIYEPRELPERVGFVVRSSSAAHPIGSRVALPPLPEPPIA